MSSRISQTALILLVGAVAALVGASYYMMSSTTDGLKIGRRSLTMRAPREEESEEDRFTIEMLKERLKPKDFAYVNGTGVMLPHQFVHLHHMKTGGTSIDDLLKCSVKRLEQIYKKETNYFSIHECSVGQFRRCLDEHGNGPCQSKFDKAGVMSYCAALKHLQQFGWVEAASSSESTGLVELPHADFSSLTVLRHPVERVWSNYRFATKGCYKCTELKEVYKHLDAGTLDSIGMASDSLCVKQMLNHQTFNLVSSNRFPEAQDGLAQVSEETEELIVKEAIDNMQNFFTMIGITEELNTFGNEMVPKVFPFMAPLMEGSHRACHLPHSNKSPTNNRCGEGMTHWDLPPHPDDETAALIASHNQMDIKLYEAAVHRFQLQKRALGVE